MFFFQFRCEKTHRTENGQASTNVSWITATKPKIYYINLKYQCKITQLSSVHPKMTWECRRNAVGMPSECRENAVGMPSECHQNVVRMPLECRRNAVGMPLECRRNAVSLLSECGLPYGKPAQGTRNIAIGPKFQFRNWKVENDMFLIRPTEYRHLAKIQFRTWKVEKWHVSDKAHGISPFDLKFNFELEKWKNDMFLIRHMEYRHLAKI
jgi:hypothetical protein